MAKTLFTLFLSFWALALVGDDEVTPEPHALDRVFVPIGFDSNDRVEVTVVGAFRNTCFRVGPYEVEKPTRVNERNTIYVTQKAYEYSGNCRRIKVPFDQVMDLGILKVDEEKEEFDIVDKTSGKKLGTVPINRAEGDQMDDHLYAPIDDAFVIRDGTTNKSKLVFWGKFTQDCYTVDAKNILEPGIYDDVVVVQPIAHKFKEDCEEKMTAYPMVSYEFDKELPKEFLLHVRSMNGKAINKIITPLQN